MVLPYHNVASGGGKTFYHYIKGVQDDPDFHVTLLAKQLPGETFDTRNLDKVNYHALSNPKLSIRHPWLAASEIWSKLNPFRKYGNTLRESIYRQVREYLDTLISVRPDVIVLEFTEMVLMAPEIKTRFPEAVIFASEHDVTFLGQQRAYQTKRNFIHKFLGYIRYEVRKRNELYALRYCDVVMPHNPKDQKLLTDNGVSGEKIFVLTPYFYNKPIVRQANHRDILFYGAMGRAENCEAVIWFLDRVMPEITDLDIRLIVLGANPQQSILERCSERVIVTGFVENVTPYFETCMCMVVPLQNGAGIKIKVLEALAAGIPVLTNKIGIEGIDAKSGQDYLHCETPEAYESAIRAMYKGDIDLRRMSESATAFMKQNYDLIQALEDYKNCIKRSVWNKDN
jgi:glycosyltransferase involved in cell wall biosynthesis